VGRDLAGVGAGGGGGAREGVVLAASLECSPRNRANATETKSNHPPSPHRRAKELIRSLLAVNPHHRPSAAQCLDHPWLRAPGAAAGAGGGAPLAGAQARLKQAYAASLGGEGFAAAMAAGREAEVAAAAAQGGGAGGG
jgi:hypothetical protein